MVLVHIEHNNGDIKKSALEAVTYGSKAAAKLGTQCVALVLGSANGAEKLGEYGASKVMQVSDAALNTFDSKSYSQVIGEVAKQVGAKLVVLGHSTTGKSLIGRLAVRLNAGSLSAVTSVPTLDGEALVVDKGVFAGKASAKYKLSGAVNVITLMGNTLKPEQTGTAATVEAANVTVPAASVEFVGVDMQSGDTVPLPEAELVVSAGRGMKGPENWGIIDELATELGATTACSRPVADTGWRPHHEHVGQTGVAIKPNLYIAAGISGAIQHLAGVNKSKCIVVINKDPEAPFFKAADYGVVGDLFDVVPRLTAAIKAAK